MPDETVEQVTARLQRTLTLGNNAFGSENASGFTESQKTQIRSLIAEALRTNYDNVSEEGYDVPVGTVTTRLEELDKVPDLVKSIREFSGKPGEFNSWKKSVDRVLDLYKSLVGSGRYYAILHTIRTKIIGDADTALESYRTPLDWGRIKRCLMLHYSDKRDIGTLEYQMTTLCQKGKSITEFYHTVYQHLSILLDKVACLDLDESSLRALTNTYREKALDTFIRGLNGDLPRLLSVREPTSLPQALHICLKLDNMSFRMNHAHARYSNDKMGLATPKKFYPELAHIGNMNQVRPNLPPRSVPSPNPQFNSSYRPNFQPNRGNPNQSLYRPFPAQNQNRNFNFNAYPRNNDASRPVPMEIDTSVQTKQLNYANRPAFNPSYKRPLGSFQGPANKVQRNFYTETRNRGVQGEAYSYDDGSHNDTVECHTDPARYAEVCEYENVEELSSRFDVRSEDTDNAFGAYSAEDLNADLNFFG